MLLRGVPARPGAVLAVAQSLGYVRETNYGRLFDVRVTATPSNLAFTGLPIASAHRQSVPGPGADRQLLHCLGGAATAVNPGWSTASRPRASAPGGPGGVRDPGRHAGDVRLCGRHRRPARDPAGDRP